jgi:Uma2 family endonuclease
LELDAEADLACQEQLVVRFPPTRPFTNKVVAAIQALNPDLRMEVDRKGRLVVMSPARPKSGALNSEVTGQLHVWSRQDRSGVAFDSSAGFRLPVTNSLRSPDASWIPRERWRALSPKERDDYSPICPDFVLELRSATDRLRDQLDKMQEYMDNGARLGWLLDPRTRRVYVFREGSTEPEVLRDPATVSGDPVLPGFVLDVRAVWQAAEDLE